MQHAAHPAAPPPVPRARKPKRPRKAGQPKGIVSCSLYFALEFRPSVRDEFGDISNAEVTKKLGEKWRAASEEQKAKFVLLAEEDKRRYEQEMQVWLSRVKIPLRVTL